MEKFKSKESFIERHVGPDKSEIEEMVKEIGVGSLDELIEKTIPEHIRMNEGLKLPGQMSEHKFITHLKEIAKKNKIFKSYIGMGYNPTITPAVILRNVLENPGWYTSYTPYQAEISQGRLQALLNYQTMVIDLTGMEIANASLLDEGTAAAEAMTMFYSSRRGAKKKANKFFISEKCFPQTIDVIQSRAEPLEIELVIGDYKTFELTDDFFGLLVQYPDSDGEINDYTELFKKADEKGILKVVAADIMSLTMLTPPGEFGADVVVGSSQRFGVPMGYGGPHAAYFATKEKFKRQVPGRIIGVSVDSNNKPALRMALQTREQHIKRENATSNICTAQVLLANIASMYAVYHGPKGIKSIAEKIYNLTALLDLALQELGFNQTNKNYFDTLKIKIDSKDTLEKIRKSALSKQINLNYKDDGYIGISLHEVAEFEDVVELAVIFAEAVEKKISIDSLESLGSKVSINWDDKFIRKSEYLTHSVFNSYYSETEMLRYLKNLEKKDISLTHSMIPLGSCTMKLNATSEMFGISWPEFNSIHPFAPIDQTEGYQLLFKDLEKQLCEITKLPAVSLQPNSGAQGEFTGLMVIREYHKSRGEGNRNVVLIPSSAHGTNPASAVMAGGKVVVVKCDDNGNIDTQDLKEKAEKNKENLSAIMITYPSTHGVFEENIKDICEIIHENGGLVYLDGANMNAQVGLTSPKEIGADVCHLNLHKTFTIPHGGGGPGVGPIAVAEHLIPFLPGHRFANVGGNKFIPAVNSAPWGSASILLISYGYIKMMGGNGLTYATKAAILNANYIKSKLENYYPILYKGVKGFVGHELIFDSRGFKNSAGIEVEDIAKRLIDYGFHAPTVSFPVPGTLMVEPTESESKYELDKFCNAMIAIRNEIKEIEEGKADKEDNVLKNSPHTAEMVIASDWNHSYSREKAAYPAEWARDNKFWTSVGRINNAYGDRNLVCSCLPIEAYEEEGV